MGKWAPHKDPVPEGRLQGKKDWGRMRSVVGDPMHIVLGNGFERAWLGTKVWAAVPAGLVIGYVCFTHR